MAQLPRELHAQAAKAVEEFTGHKQGKYAGADKHRRQCITLEFFQHPRSLRLNVSHADFSMV